VRGEALSRGDGSNALRVLCVSFVVNAGAIAVFGHFDPPAMCWPRNIYGLIALVLALGETGLAIAIPVLFLTVKLDARRRARLKAGSR
jgi:hypothetical protein